MGTDNFRHFAQFYAPGTEHLFELLDSLEASVYKWLIREYPDPLDRLQFGRVGGEEGQQNSFLHLALVQVPASVIQHEDDSFSLAHPLLLGKDTEQEEKDILVHRRGEPKRRTAALRVDKGREIGPLVAGIYHRPGPLTPRCPASAKYRLKANPVLIHGPEFYFGVWVLAFLATYEALELYFDPGLFTMEIAVG